jgi:nitroreductase
MATLPLSPDELLTTTRSVRKRLDLARPVPLELVRECLEIALQAPSGSNRQDWHWIVVTDPAQRAAIGAVYRRAFATYAADGGPGVDRYAGDPGRQATQRRVADSAAWLGDHMGEVPVQVIACRSVGSLATDSQADVWGSLLPAAWSYMLAARARRLGTAWTTLHLDHEDEVAEILDLPDDIRQGVLIPTAYYTGETFRPAPREPLDTVLHLDRW